VPENLAGINGVLPRVADELHDMYVNIMDQYHWPVSVVPPAFVKEKPEYRALLRPITGKEYADAIRWAKAAGLFRWFRCSRVRIHFSYHRLWWELFSFHFQPSIQVVQDLCEKKKRVQDHYFFRNFKWPTMSGCCTGFLF
jgi:hypothetical protein